MTDQSEIAVVNQPLTMKALENLLPTLPDRYQNIGDVIATIMAGRELGIPPMAALGGLYVVNGQTGMATETMVGLAQRAGHQIRPVNLSTTSATAEAWRRTDEGGVEHVSSITYTIEDAELAGLLEKPAWKKHPMNMLWWKAAARAVRFNFPETLLGHNMGLAPELQVRPGEVPGETVYVVDDEDDTPALSAEEVAEVLDAELVLDDGTPLDDGTVVDEETGEILSG